MMHMELPQYGPTASIRERELETGRLVLRAAQSGDAFLVRRAAAAVSALAKSPVRRALRRTAVGLQEQDAAMVQTGLLSYGAVLERHGVHDAAAEAYALVRTRCDDACVALHHARASRKSGQRAEAASLYREVREQARGNAAMELMARTGEALVAPDPVAALGEVARVARARGVWEVVAVAREERARLTSSLRDLLCAAGRYPDATDRVRVLHRIAEMLTARDDLMGAREALLAALDHVSDGQRPHTVQRMRTVARAMGDDLTVRRTRGAASPVLVTLAPAARRRAVRTLAPRLWRWRMLMAERVEA